LCLLASIHFWAYSKLNPYSSNPFNTSWSIGTLLNPTITPSTLFSLTILYHICFLISSTPYLLFGSVFSIFFNKSLDSILIYFGLCYSPLNIFLYSAAVFGSSKGNYPQIIANNITPVDQISTWIPTYFLPATISGAA